MIDDRYAAALVDLILRWTAWGLVVEKVLEKRDCAFCVIRRRAKHSVHMESNMAVTMASRWPQGRKADAM